ncbi:radical SAM family heme chaperone HemW, partial [bacterium]|nr:radical SAM family heme chaperone HemW [bacterium]
MKKMINCTYLHIPFCKTKCHYCAFCSFPLLRAKDKYIEGLIKEIKYFYKNEYQKTIYFGGGTPSLLDIEDVEKILSYFNFDYNTSITFELNPENAQSDYLLALKNLGINRISLGVQSFDDEILKLLNRCHTSSSAMSAIDNIKKAGFDNISIDLMYGLPNQNEKIWLNTLNKALELDLAHISLYGLKIEKGTKFYSKMPDNLPSLDTQADMYKNAISLLNKKY